MDDVLPPAVGNGYVQVKPVVVFGCLFDPVNGLVQEVRQFAPDSY